VAEFNSRKLRQLAAVQACALAATALPVLADDTQSTPAAEDVETVVVTGIRAGLRNSLEGSAKRRKSSTRFPPKTSATSPTRISARRCNA
jgi:hypothetical protein